MPRIIFAQINRPPALSHCKPSQVMPTPASDANWRTCFDELAPRLLLYARQWLASLPDAEDAVQEGFVRFWRHRPDAGRADYPLLYSAVRSAALDLLRKEHRRARRETVLADEPLHDGQPLFDASVDQREWASTIARALEDLPREQREVVVLRLWGELTFQQIASMLDESINTIAARYRYALQTLRRVVKPEHYERV